MFSLILETSTERGVIALYQDTLCVFQEQLPYGFQSSHFALPILQKELEKHKFSLENLSFIAVGVGPGSYTGIRVGVTIAKSLAFAFEVPLIGVCTLDTFLPDSDGEFAAVIDAKMGGVYLKTGYAEQGVIKTFLQPAAYSLEEAAKILQNVKTLATPNAQMIRPKLEALVLNNQWAWQESCPQATILRDIAKGKLASGSFSDHHLELLYMRKTQAEIEKENKRISGK